MQEENFLCYTSGILTGKAFFHQEGVAVQRRPYSSAEFSVAEEISGEKFVDPKIHKLWLLDAGKARWTQECVQLGEFCYERSCSVDGGKGWIYAQMRSSCPVDVVSCEGRLVGFMIPARNESITIVADTYQDSTNLAWWKDECLSPADYLTNFIGTFSVPMRDQVLLATDVILPFTQNTQNLKKFPSILVRTCYNKEDNRELWERYAARGYAVIVQDVRGREASEGEWMPFVNEAPDGSDTLDWIAAQPWSDGNIGMLGGSYLGYVQWAAASTGNPHLKALVSQVTAGSPFVDLPRRGGTFNSGTLAWSFMVAKRKTDKAACQRDDWDSLLSHRPLSEIPQKALKEAIPFYDRWMEHENDDAFWQRADWSRHGSKIDLPALYISGWFDDDGPGTTQAWAMNRENQRKNQRMILGPWLHKTNSSRQIHGYSLAKNALRYDLDLLYLRWFDRFLKGIENGVEERPAVEYYMLGENRWYSDEQWPPAASKAVPLYLQNATGERHSGKLSPLAVAQEGQISYPFDPADPFPYVIDVSENECAIPGEYSQAEKREDVLLYTSEPMSAPLAIAGQAKVEFTAASSAPDTDWVVRLTDLSPEGSSVKLADGLLRARYRHSFQAPVLLTPGQKEQYSITMTRIAHTFLPGHRIRLQITSGAKNDCFPNSNTGTTEGYAKELLCAQQSIFAGGSFGSCLVLPVLSGEIPN